MNEVMEYLPEPEQCLVRWDVKARRHGDDVDYSRICGPKRLHDRPDPEPATETLIYGNLSS